MRVCANSILGGCAKNSVFSRESETFPENPGVRGWRQASVTIDVAGASPGCDSGPLGGTEVTSLISPILLFPAEAIVLSAKGAQFDSWE